MDTIKLAYLILLFHSLIRQLLLSSMGGNSHMELATWAIKSN